MVSVNVESAWWDSSFMSSKRIRAKRGEFVYAPRNRHIHEASIHHRDRRVTENNKRGLSTSMHRSRILRDMKTFLSFLCGVAVMLGFTTLHGSNPSRHVYELRMYHVHERKMDALKTRFGDHTDALFKRHNMKSIGYWVPEDAPSSQNLFVYILQHPSRQEAEKNWAAFQADPEWKKVKADSEKNGPLVDHIDRYFMDPTSYSALN